MADPRRRTANDLPRRQRRRLLDRRGIEWLVVVDRTMTWGGGYGSHAETALAAPSTTWFLAEGATHGRFSLFYLLQNPGAAPATVAVDLPAPCAGRPGHAPVHAGRGIAFDHRRRRDRGARGHRRLGQDRVRRADPRRARDVRGHAQPGADLRGRARRRRGHGDQHAVVPGRRRDRIVLRPLLPDREPVLAGDDGA